MKIFVTGASGFIGQHFCRKAVNDGHDLICLVRSSKASFDEPKIRWVEGDLSTRFPECCEGVEAYVHLAAHGVHALNDWEGCFRWNVVESLRLWRDAITSGISQFLIVGSCFEYGQVAEKYDLIPVTAELRPTGAYHASKASASMAALALACEQKLKLTIARPFHVYGEGESASRFWPSLRKAAISGSDLEMTSGKQVRDFTPVETAAEKLVHEVESLEKLESGSPRIVNLGTGKPKSLAQFAREEWERFEAKGELRFGALADRKNEVYRYVPEVENHEDA